MANATITVLEADGSTQTDVVVLDVGRQAAAASKSVAASTEDKAVLDAIAASLALLDNSIASGNELQVDVVGALPAGTNAIGKLAANSGVDIGDVDVTSIIPGTGATNLGKAEDTAHSSGDVGVMALAVRQDSQSDFGADGDYVPLSIDADGALRVSGAGGGTQYTEDAAAAGDPVGNMLMAVRRDTLATNEVSADGDNIALKATNKGQLHVAAQIGSGTATVTITDGAPAASDYGLVVALHPDSVNANGQNTAANSAPVVLSDYGKTVLKSVTMSTDTSQYASGDLIADTQQVDAALRVADGKGILQSITIIDEDNQGAALYVLIMRTSTSMGTENSAPNISDANLTAGLIGIVSVATTDYITLSGAKVAFKGNLGIPIQAVSGTDDIYIAVLNGAGTPTYTASGLEMVLGIQQD